MRLNDLLDADNLTAMVSEGFVRACPGPDGMTLYNYTDRAQYTRTWNRETLTCRGLVVTADGLVQSRPFGKFFNLSEHELETMPDLPLEPFDVFEKVDGSLIVVSARGGQRLVTSRGSFDSEHAVAAAAWLDDNHPELLPPDGVTWCFELIAPWNRIVVNYGDRNELVFLAAIDNTTGLDLPTPDAWTGAVVRTLDGLADFTEIQARLDRLGANEEGYVLRFASGQRAKAKGSEYMRLHRLVTGVSNRTVWDLLANGRDLAEVLDRVPDEFYAWVEHTANELNGAFGLIQASCDERHRDIATLPSRKDQALALADFQHRAVVFRMLDGKPYAEAIWKVLRPERAVPFAIEG